MESKRKIYIKSKKIDKIKIKIKNMGSTISCQLQHVCLMVMV